MTHKNDLKLIVETASERCMSKDKIKTDQYNYEDINTTSKCQCECDKEC